MAHFRQNQELDKEKVNFPYFLISCFLPLAIFLLIWGWRLNLRFKEKRATSGPVIIEGIIWEEPKIFYSAQSFWLKGYRVETLSDYPLTVGDRVVLAGEVVCQETEEFKENCFIDYPEISFKETDFWSRIIKGLAGWRKKLIVSLEQVLPPEAASLLAGIVWGNQGQFSQNFYYDMKNSGLLHVVIASGANVMGLVDLLRRSSFFWGRRLSILITLPVIIIYGLVVGLEPPIIRAVLMSGLFLFSQLFGRQTKPLRSLFWAGGIMMIFDPWLFADIGFQLSFGATLGILLFSKQLKRLLGWSNLATSLAAQTITLPILAFYFGQLSPLSFLSNAFLLWLIEPLMLWGLLLTFLGLFSRFLAGLVGFFFWLPLQAFILGGRFWARILPNIEISPDLAIWGFVLAPLLWLLLSLAKDDK